MASEAERDAGNSARPSTSGTTIKVKVLGRTEVEINDVWTSGVLVTAISGSTVYLVKGLVTKIMPFLDYAKIMFSSYNIYLVSSNHI